METGNNFVFKGLQIVAWIIFVGLSIEAGALIVNFIFSIFNPAMVGNLYEKLDLTKMYAENKWAFFGTYSLAMFIAVLKAVLFYVMIELLRKLDLANPFNTYVANKISSIATYTFSIGIISHIAREVVKNMKHHGYEVDQLNEYWVDSQAFILMAAVVYIIAQIFKRGIEIQSENDLTV